MEECPGQYSDVMKTGLTVLDGIARMHRRKQFGERPVYFSSRLFKGVRFWPLALVLFFSLCQVIGLMCAVPDVALADDTAVLSEESMVCPMQAGLMCPPLLTSSPDRQVKSQPASDLLDMSGATCPGAQVDLSSISADRASDLSPPFLSRPVVSIKVLRI
jgi:hypothetical protein